MTRPVTTEHTPHTWKEALHASLFRSTEPLKAIADQCGVSKQYLQAAADEDQPQANLSARHLPALARLCSNLAFLDFLEAQAGRLAFRLPTSTDATSIGHALREVGEWVEIHGQALEDGVVTEAEFVRAEKEAREAVGAVLAAVEQLRARVTPAPVMSTSIRMAR